MTFIQGFSPRSGKTEAKVMRSHAKVLLVEDHPTTARALKMYLETQRYSVEVVGDVASALKTATARPFDLLICDLSLPDGTGWDLMKKLSRNGPVRAIAFTASGSPEDVARSERVGFLKHIVKGCPAEDLTAVIEEVLKLDAKPTSSRVAKKRKTAKS